MKLHGIDADHVLRINRNIVECKDCCEEYVRERAGVLIETSWNVKLDSECEQWRWQWY